MDRDAAAIAMAKHDRRMLEDGYGCGRDVARAEAIEYE